MTSDRLHADFSSRLVAWQQSHGRHDLPWQGTDDPYRVWLSEIMLQQTQVDTVAPFYTRFLGRFPNIACLAAASEDEVLACWSGLGYYSRARNLLAAARIVMADHAGRFPAAIEAILGLPGIGRSTAAAIAVFAFDQRRAILDGNVKRVLARVFGIEGWPGEKSVETRMWTLAESLLPPTAIRPYTQGLMDLGATLCKRGKPDCAACPFVADCHACRLGRQAELPGARPRKRMPEKSTGMLILQSGAEVLLEKRPTVGIWGGLWSLPECSADADPGREIASLGYQAEGIRRGVDSSHAFTHFRLNIQPWFAQVRRISGANEPGRIWLALHDIDAAALPAPVRRILDSLRRRGEQAG